MASSLGFVRTVVLVVGTYALMVKAVAYWAVGKELK